MTEFHEEKEKHVVRWMVAWMKDIVLVISLALFFVYAFGTQVRMVGQSMSPFLESNDVVLMDRISYRFFEPERFDVVIFDKGDGSLHIKRVIGLPGETIQIRGGRIYVNDELLKTSEALQDVPLAGLAAQPIELQEGEYFLLGDNRTGSEDSRFADIGNVEKGQIKGKAWLRIFPLISLKWIQGES